MLDQWFDAINRQDVEALCELADPEIEVVPLETSETAPPGTTYHGHDGLRTIMGASFKRFPKLRLKYSAPEPSGANVSVDLDWVLDDGVGPPRTRSAGCLYRIAHGRVLRLRAIEDGRPLSVRHTTSRADALSRREREVLSMIAGGQTIAEIAADLVLSPFTVRTHVRNAKDKLRARTTAHAVAIALEEKVLDPLSRR